MVRCADGQMDLETFFSESMCASSALFFEQLGPALSIRSRRFGTAGLRECHAMISNVDMLSDEPIP